ncbi:ABC transporter permease family protein [Kineosporia babensis]|uniref:FtsX-like permease family protein n=1 Tax=Kineosporia babensis TaxID=499548 RepID=A0A9X1T412_9ACTN|nr:hypothetical protein [Kineosporia babensis]MCD5316243.1 hypothetical protein [Kineosporia babensis]
MRRNWPLLRRAPGRLLRSGSLALMITTSVALLAGLVAAGPLFERSTAAGSLERKLATVPANSSAGRQAAVNIVLTGRIWDETRPEVVRLLEEVPWLGPTGTSVWPASYQLQEGNPLPFLEIDGQRRPAMVFHRTGAIEALEVVQGERGAKGLWLPDSVAEDFALKPGDEFKVGKTFAGEVPPCESIPAEDEPGVPPTRASAVVLAGTYRTAADGRLPAGRYFSSIASRLPSDPTGCPFPALLMIGDPETVQAALTAADELKYLTFFAGLDPSGRLPERLRDAAAAAADLQRGASDPTGDLRVAVTGQGAVARVETGLPQLQAQAEDDARAAAQQGRGIALAGATLGLAAVVMALRALAQRRRRETELLVGLGTPPHRVVLTGALELTLPAVIGAATGGAVAYLAFEIFGPQRNLGLGALVDTVGAVALVVAFTLVGNAVVTLLQARSISRRLAGRESFTGRAAGRGPWLPLLIGATALAVLDVLARDRRASYTDPLSSVLPILILASGSLLLVRLAPLVTKALNRARPQGRSVDRLVLRGLRDTGVAVTDLVVILAIGVGVLAYGLVSASVVHASVHDKTSVLAGAVSAAQIPGSRALGGADGLDPELSEDLSVLWRAPGLLRPGRANVDVLVINPETFPEVALWGEGAELAEARQALSVFDEPVVGFVPALMVGLPGREPGSGGTVAIGNRNIEFAVNGQAAAFPGATRSAIVFDARSLLPRIAADREGKLFVEGTFDGDQNTFSTWLWSTRPADALENHLEGLHITPLSVTSIEQAEATPALTSSGWAATYQTVLGVAALALAGLAVLVAVDRRVARAAPVDLVLRRFGVKPARLIRLRAVELVLTCLAALAVLVVPFGLVMVLLPRLVEPGPTLSPALGMQLPIGPLLLSVLAAAVVTAAAVRVAARRSATLKPAEVLRDDQ